MKYDCESSFYYRKHLKELNGDCFIQCLYNDSNSTTDPKWISHFKAKMNCSVGIGVDILPWVLVFVDFLVIDEYLRAHNYPSMSRGHKSVFSHILDSCIVLKDKGQKLNYVFFGEEGLFKSRLTKC